MTGGAGEGKRQEEKVSLLAMTGGASEEKSSVFTLFYILKKR